MVEENPHIEVKTDNKSVMNSRQQYFQENEKLILWRHGFIFSTNPTTKEKLEMFREEKNQVNKSCKLNRYINFGKITSRNIIENNKNPNKYQYQHQLLKSKSQQYLLSQSILRFKNGTDLERICDTIEPKSSYKWTRFSKRK